MAAQLGALGLDPLRFLYSKDTVELATMMELGKRIQKEREKLDNNLAVTIANTVLKGLGGK